MTEGFQLLKRPDKRAPRYKFGSAVISGEKDAQKLERQRETDVC